MRLLVADGNTAEVRAHIVQTAGATPSEGYAQVLQTIVQTIAPEATIDLCAPADEGAKLAAELDSYDGVAITGSALSIHRLEPASLRQIDFVRGVFARGIPMFGSCWGLQLAAVAAGGEVGPNARGREVAFARKVTLTEAGRGHPMHVGRPRSFDAPAIHGDEILRLPDDAVVTAANSISAVQAAEIRHRGGTFWGVQYHPEYRLRDIAAMVRRYGMRLVTEGFFADANELESYAADLDLLQSDDTRRDIAWRYGLGPEITDERQRVYEIANWIAELVRPTRSARGRE